MDPQEIKVTFEGPQGVGKTSLAVFMCYVLAELAVKSRVDPVKETLTVFPGEVQFNELKVGKVLTISK